MRRPTAGKSELEGLSVHTLSWVSFTPVGHQCMQRDTEYVSQSV